MKSLTKQKYQDYIKSMLSELFSIDVDNLTTFELNFIDKFAKNPPKKYRGVENKILDFHE